VIEFVNDNVNDAGASLTTPCDGIVTGLAVNHQPLIRLQRLRSQGGKQQIQVRTGIPGGND
jgi:hypothetical protein